MYEIEVKGYFFPEEKALVREIESKLSTNLNRSWSTHKITDVFLERNNELQKIGFDLRCRKQDAEIFLTLKGPIDKTSGFKIRDEIEIRCDNWQNLLDIFFHLGFRKKRQITKKRKLMKTEKVLVTIDFYSRLGYVIEIEGPKEHINEVLNFLHPSIRSRFGAITFQDVLKQYRKHILKQVSNGNDDNSKLS
ncbi:MAG: class IV adenylate cyclase [Candidatus Heimdallarchaeaceae archaeon]